MKATKKILVLSFCWGLAMESAGCGSSSQAQKTVEQEAKEARERAKQAGDEVSDAVKNAKPELNKAGEKAGEAARTVVDDTRAAAHGVRQGWEKDEKPLVNLNTAKEKDLTALPGIGP